LSQSGEIATAPEPIAPPLPPALAAMTALQGIVALALFAPGVLAPRLGIAEGGVALFTTCCFATGVAGALFGGALVGRLGSFGVAAFCMAATAAAMALASLGHPLALALAGLALGCAFGPETPASSALLGRLARPGQQGLIFSVRQTGNQFGAILGSVTLPALAAVIDPRLGYFAVAGVAVMGGVLFLALRPRYDALTYTAARSLDPRASLSLMRGDRGIGRLALASVPLSAMQLGLNAFLVTYLTQVLALPHVTAGILLGVAQAGGLVGRLAWGAVADQVGAARPVIASLALGATASAVTLASLPAGAPWGWIAVVAFTLGLTASGWNGVFLAEVARAAPEGRVAEATGATLTASYCGLLAAPGMIWLIAQASDLRTAYAVLGAACLVAAWSMRR
jgi:MFS family permease